MHSITRNPLLYIYIWHCPFLCVNFILTIYIFLSNASDFCLKSQREHAEIKLTHNILPSPIYSNPWRQINTETEPIIHSFRIQVSHHFNKSASNEASRKRLFSRRVLLALSPGRKGGVEYFKQIIHANEMRGFRISVPGSQGVRPSVCWAAPGTSPRGRNPLDLQLI